MASNDLDHEEVAAVEDEDNEDEFVFVDNETNDDEFTLVEHENNEDGIAAVEEYIGPPISPIFQLEEVAEEGDVIIGEQDEDTILDLKGKLYRFDKDGKRWKERGYGAVKLLKHKETGKVRLSMHQSHTLKLCANHLVVRSTSVQQHACSTKSCVWHAADFAEGEVKHENFCVRFLSVENCKKFMETMKEVAKSQQKVA